MKGSLLSPKLVSIMEDDPKLHTSSYVYLLGLGLWGLPIPSLKQTIELTALAYLFAVSVCVMSVFGEQPGGVGSLPSPCGSGGSNLGCRAPGQVPIADEASGQL